MTSVEEMLERRARWAYEMGRLRRALLWVLPVLALVVLALALQSSVGSSLLLGSGIALAAVGMSWWGRDLGRAVSVGLGAGAIAAAFPALVRTCGVCCIAGGCTSWCLIGCVGGGAAAGMLIGRMARTASNRFAYAVAGSVLALGVGALTCQMFGTIGMGGLLVAEVSAMSTLVIFAPARS